MREEAIERKIGCNCDWMIVNWLSTRSSYHPYRMRLRVRHDKCRKCGLEGLGPRACLIACYQTEKFNGNVLLKSNPLDSGKWMDVEEAIPYLHMRKNPTRLQYFEDLSIHVFYCVVNHKIYVFRPSFEQYCRVKNGHFWIGHDYDGFYIDGDDFGNTINISSIRNINGFTMDVFINGKWLTVDLSSLCLHMTEDEFKDIRFHGYGGLIWRNKDHVSNREIWRLCDEQNGSI